MKNIRYELKKMTGFILGIGQFDDKFLSEVMKNDNISFSILTNDNSDIVFKKRKKSELVNPKNNKSINIKKIKKVFKKQKPDYIILDVYEVKDYLKTFVKDSLYITKNKIYINTSSKDIDLNDIYKLYKRYHKKINIDNDYIIIDMEGYHNNILKNIFYYVIDCFVGFYYFISNVITS